MRTTFIAKTAEIERKWYVVDATDLTLGRLASQVAAVLRGKNKPIYTPHIDTGDYVIVVNADKIKVTGKKMEQKLYLSLIHILLVPVVVAQIIDVGVANNDHTYIVERFGVLLLMAAVGLTCSITAQFFAAKASVGFATNVRKAMFNHIQALSFTEIDTLGSDTLITRLTDDVNLVQNGLNMALRLMLRSPFIVIGAMVMAFTINVKCAIVFVVTIPVLFVVILSIMLVSICLLYTSRCV